MGIVLSTEQPQAELEPEKHQNGDLNGHVINISAKDGDDVVACEAAVQQNSELPSSPLTKASEPPPEPPSEPPSEPPPEPTPEPNSTDSRPNGHVPQEEKPHFLNKLFKKKTPETPSDEVDTGQASEPLPEPPSEPPSESPPEPTPEPTPEPNSTDSRPNGHVPQEEKPRFLNKLFKKKTPETPSDEVDTGQEPEGLKTGAETATDPETEVLDSCLTEDDTSKAGEDTGELVDIQEGQSQEEDNTVMSFFKTLVNPTKKPKGETTLPDVPKDQSLKDNQPAKTNAPQDVAAKVPAKEMHIPPPPPPPPEVPKTESKAESATKPAKSTQKEEPKDTASKPQTPTKHKGTFGKLFRPKVTKEEPQPIEGQVDASKASTLEASAQPEKPLQPEETKPAKSTSFLSKMKSKVLLSQVVIKVKSDSTKETKGPAGLAANAKKDTPVPPAEVEVKEEPKVMAKPKSPEPPVDNKSLSLVSQSEEDSPSASRKIEKRNSIHLFFKHLGQKRLSDAGVQTEPVTITTSPEKAK